MNRMPSWADPGLGVALVIATVAAWPLLSRASLPTFTDAQHHIYRAYEILAAWHEGIPYLRWAPDFYYGFGYPVFNYYSTLTYYLAAAYAWFFGPVAGIKFVLVLAMYLGTVGVYLFTRENWGAPAATVGACAFAFAPYILLDDPIQRGAAPETLAIGLAPLVLWSFSRLVHSGSRRSFVAAVLSLAALILAHNLISFVFIGLLGAWLLSEALFERVCVTYAGCARTFARAAVAGLLALALTSFMWLPAFLERDTVQFRNAFAGVKTNRFNIAQDLFRPGSVGDAETFFVGAFKYPIGLPQWALGLAGALTVLRPGPQRRRTLFFGLMSVTAIGLMLPQASFIWDRVPLLQYLQFSFRLMGPTALGLAWLAGAATQWAQVLPKPVTGSVLATLMVAAYSLAALPMLNPLHWAEFGPVTPKAIVDLELTGLWDVGTTSAGEFLPIGVHQNPRPVQAVLAALAVGTVEKVDRPSLPPGASVEMTGHNSLRDDFSLSAPASFTLRLLTFYWPGWTAYLDGVQTPIQVTEPEGGISVVVPAGRHLLTVQLEDTAPRRVGWAMSAAALVAFLMMAVVRLQPAAVTDQPRLEPLSGRTALAFASIIVAGLALRFALNVGIRWQAAHVIPRVADAQVQRYTRFDDGMALVAYDFPQTTAKPGDLVPLTFYWEVIAPMSQPASVFVHFYGPDGQLWGQSDQPDPIEFFPTTRWPMGETMSDAHRAVLKPGAPFGNYTVDVGLWNRATGVRSHPLDSNGQTTELDKLTLTDQFKVAP